MALERYEWFYPRARRALVIFILLCGCSTNSPPHGVILWTWSQGERAESLQSLVERFNEAQSSIVVKAKSWDAAVIASQSPSKALPELVRFEGSQDVPSLIEVPEEVLVALVEADLARDMSGHHATRLGVRFDDVHDWLLPASRIRSKGIVGLPLFHEVPVFLLQSGSGYAELAQDEGFEAFQQPAIGVDGDRRILAAGADYRIFLAFLRETSALDASQGVGSEAFYASRAKSAGSLIKAVFTHGMLEQGQAGNEMALKMFLAGEAEAALVWSSQLDEISRDDVELIRAPMRTRGTYLAIYANAPWRLRQDAFRVAQWISEPLQTSELARTLWTVPIRKSAGRSARYRNSRAWRVLGSNVLEEDRPIRLPANAAFVEMLRNSIEPALVHGAVNEGLLRRLQRTLDSSDENAKTQRGPQQRYGL